MKLKHLKIANCSRVSDIDIEVRDNLVLIGPNGSGKSTVLLCLDMLLGMNGLQLRKALSEEFIRDKSQPMIVEAVFEDLGEDELMAFSNVVGPQNNNDLSIRLDVCLNDGRTTVMRSFPGCGTQKSPSLTQREAFGWTLLKVESKMRDVLLEQESLEAIKQEPSNRPLPARSDAQSLETIKQELAGKLSQALPFAFGKDDLELAPGATASNDLINSVRLRIREDGRMQNVNEQSDGTRALFTMALYDLLCRGTNILAIDEPEAHLHPSSQRSLAKMLRASSGQKVLVTHSPTIAGSFEPEEIVVIHADGTAVQPKSEFLRGDLGMLARWWIGRQLEPLTAGAVIAVEGPSDRIIVDKVASALGFDLDRNDVVLVETNGCGDMKVVESIFGDGGFGIPLYELIDEDAREDAARRHKVNPTDLEAHDVFVSTRDLEDEYVQAIGAKRLWDKMKAANTFSKNVFALCRVGADGYPSEADLAEFIRGKSNRKIPSALLAAELIDSTNARGMGSVTRLLKAASS